VQYTSDVVAPDYYAEARGIEQALAATGRGDLASRIRDAILAGSTGTEILMGLRWTLREIISSEANLHARIKERMSSLAAALDRALS
jgi:hypothetical protein